MYERSSSQQDAMRSCLEQLLHRLGQLAGRQAGRQKAGRQTLNSGGRSHLTSLLMASFNKVFLGCKSNDCRAQWPMTRGWPGPAGIRASSQARTRVHCVRGVKVHPGTARHRAQHAQDIQLSHDARAASDPRASICLQLEFGGWGQATTDSVRHAHGIAVHG
jgi:hypothetical protein